MQRLLKALQHNQSWTAALCCRSFGTHFNSSILQGMHQPIFSICALLLDDPARGERGSGAGPAHARRRGAAGDRRRLPGQTGPRARRLIQLAPRLNPEKGEKGETAKAKDKHKGEQSVR